MIESNDELITRKIAESIDFFLDSAKEPEKRRGSMPASIKKVVKSWHGKECPLCAVKMVHTPDKGAGKLKENEASWEHVLDLSLGGENRLDNATVICDRCNSANNSTMINYIGSFGESFGTMRWKEAFVRDSRNLVRLHRFVEWKLNSILRRSPDSNQELSRIWARYRYGRTIQPESPIYGREGAGLFSRILSLFRPNRNGSMEANTEPASAVEKPELNKDREYDKHPPPVDSSPPLSVDAKPTVSQEKRILSWSELDRGSEDELGRLLVYLIGHERMVNAKLGLEISKFQKRNNLNGTGSRGLFKEFGITLTNSKTMKSIISEKFPHLIRVEQVSRTQCYYSLVNGKK